MRFNDHAGVRQAVAVVRQGVIMQIATPKLETDIDQCLGLLSVMLTHNDFSLLSQDDIQSCLLVLDEKLRNIKGGVGL